MTARGWLLSVALAATVFPLPAVASLGDDLASVETDQVRMSGTLTAKATPAYMEFEIRTPSGTSIREYVSSTGVVFAIAWTGPSLPDLRQVMGRFFARYVEAGESAGAGTGPRAIEQPDLVVHAGGHMRAFVGRAFVPELMPKGVNLEAIR